MKLFSATLLLVLLVLCSSFLLPSMAIDPPMVPPGDCNPKCEVRCSRAGKKERCLKYCGLCCKECHCVPSGTYGNKAECPCYMNKLNAKGKPKCP